MKRLAVVVGLTAGILLLASPAGAHPLGNFTTNTYAGLQLSPDHVDIDYVLDLAEIPALEAIERASTDGDDILSTAERAGYASRTCGQVASGVRLAIDGRSAQLHMAAANAGVRPGQAGLHTLRIECKLRALTTIRADAAVAFDDTNFAGRVGWHELTAAGDRTIIVDGPGAKSVSARLTSYPKKTAPLDQRTASFTARPGGPRLAVGSNRSGRPTAPLRGMDRFTTAFTDLVARQHLNVAFGLFAIAIATVLGATHALAPGHGKTVIAAYIISQGGARRVAVVLGVTVAVSHTAGVLVLGTVVSTSAGVAPEHLYPALGAISGLTFAALGAMLLIRARRRAPVVHGQVHHHGHDHHRHPHDDHHHHEGAAGTSHMPPAQPTWRTALLPGLAGGLVPSPSALLVYLGGLAIGRTWFAVLLVAGYGVGIALTLVTAGYLLGRARNRMSARPGRWRWAPRIQRALPTVTAALVILGGLQITARSLAFG